MRTLRRLSPSFLLVPLCLALAPAADEVGFHPKADLELAKKLEIELEPEIRNVTFSMNGQDMGEGIKEVLGKSALVNLSVEVKDTYAKTKNGRIEELVRAFDKVGLHAEFDDDSNDVNALEKISTPKVRFVWDEKASEYTRSFEGGSGDDKLIAALEADMDVTALLPGKSVSSGDTWDVAGTKLGGLFLPGGMFQFGDDEDASSPKVDTDKIEKMLAEAFEKFKATCTYKGTSEKEGAKLGAIDFEFDDKIELNLGDLLHDALSEQMGGDDVELELRVSLTLKGHGTLTWDMAAGHVHELDMQADISINGSFSMHGEQEGQEMSLEASIEAGGPGTWKMTVE